MAIRIATVRDPQSAEYVKTLALREKNRDRALALWASARQLAPDNPTLIGHQAHALLDACRDRAADPTQPVDGVDKPDARDHAATLGLSPRAQAAGMADVIDVLVPAIEAHPRNIHLANLLGVALFERGHAADAMRLFEHCLALDAEYRAARASRDNCLAARKRSRPAPARVSRAIDAALAKAAGLSPPTLSVCMIAKDEAEFIVGAIESVRGLAHQIIVVDTGSEDNTVDLARKAGAVVELVPWQGDFSAARNASVARATGDWVLVLDADERVDEASRMTIRAIMEESVSDGGGPHRIVCPKIRNFTRAKRFLNDGFSGRLFRNLPAMRFSGRVHEEVAVGVPDAFCDYRLDVVLNHYGADPEVMREKAKDDRNVGLLEARLAEKPDDLLTWFYLGSQHWVGQRPGKAREAFERVVELFERNPGRYGMAVRHVPAPYSYVGLVRCLLLDGRAATALDVGNRGLARWPDNADLWYHTAFAHLSLGERAMARRFLSRALEVEPTGYSVISMRDASIKVWRAEKMLGDLDYDDGEKASAYARYLRVVEKMLGEEEAIPVAARVVELACELGEIDALPAHTEVYLNLRPTEHDVALQVAQLLLQKSGHQAAYDLLSNLYAKIPPLQQVADIPLVVGQIAEAAGEDREALRWYERVVELGCEDPTFWANMAKIFLRTGQPDGAADALRIARGFMAPST